MLLVLINTILFALFYANVFMLIGQPVWLSFSPILPIWLIHFFYSSWEIRFLSYSAKASLLVGMVAMVVVVLRALLTAKPVVDLLLLPLLVSVIIFYVLDLYFRWLQLKRPSTIGTVQITYWVAGPSLLMSFALAVVLAVYCLFALSLLAQDINWLQPLAIKFVSRGIIPPITLIFFFWALLILMSKWVLLSMGQQSLFGAAGQEKSEEMSNNREDLVAQMWQQSSEAYLIPKYLNWSIPILGFIGTVLGISLAADGIQGVIASQQSLSELSGELGIAIAPLGIAFDTTLIALSLSILLTLFQTLQQRSEDRTLNAITRTLKSEA